MAEETPDIPERPIDVAEQQSISKTATLIADDVVGGRKEVPGLNEESDLVRTQRERLEALEAEKEKEADQDAQDQLNKMEEEDEILEPLTDSKRWVIGKPPEQGGKSTQYGVYYQRPLGFMARNRFIALVTKTMSVSIRATGGDIGGMGEVFGQGEGTILERGKRLRNHDFQDASSFFALAMELIGYTPEFLSECYALFLNVPKDDRGWFREIIEQKYDPENGQWGLSEEDGLEMIELFIHQNYEDMRRFFLEKLPKIAKRVSQIEKARADKQLDQSLPLKS